MSIPDKSQPQSQEPCAWRWRLKGEPWDKWTYGHSAPINLSRGLEWEVEPMYPHPWQVSAIEPPLMTFSHAQAVCILKVRDALIAKDLDGAYHWLYTLDSKQIPHDPFKPWASTEKLASTDGGTDK